MSLQSMSILIPVYNDWESIRLLLPGIDAAVAGIGATARVILVDDGSSTPPPQDLADIPLTHLARVDVLALRRNLGHQRAIAVGLCYVHAHSPGDAVLVMDGDGEDLPGDIPRLVARFREEGGGKVTFAERARRPVGIGFRAGYHAYRLMHWILTGLPVKVGNFSLVPSRALDRLVVVSDLWNHYAASVFKARLPNTCVRLERGRRLCGESSMNLVSLVVHGLSAMSVHADLVGVRLMLSFAALLGGALAALAVGLGYRFVSGAGVSPGFALGFGVLLLVLLQVGLFALVACFITLGARNVAGFIPQRDYMYFVDKLIPVTKRA